ncbi:uncharacterized protein LOC107013320 [Solanum pennellii]|uniref:Uncharacterized protein LOC107013320 n=1 Tax=Solanum pennellii TaxID=28526 RepID=A0ABM1GBM9_SOLPN|nr:uncharacterized protein LOC107013320 [Solanum pennellii]
MVADRRSMMSLFVAGLSHIPTKEGRAAMLIRDMDISRLMVYMQQVKEEKLRYTEEFKNKKAKTGNESGSKKSQGCFKCGQEGHFIKECPKNRQGSGNQDNRAQSSSVAPPDRDAPREATSSTGEGENRLYAITSRHEQENSPNIVTCMIKVFTFDVYALLDLG